MFRNYWDKNEQKPNRRTKIFETLKKLTTLTLRIFENLFKS